MTVRRALNVARRFIAGERRFVRDCLQVVEDERVRRELDQLRAGLGGRPNPAVDRDLRRAAELRRQRRQ